MKSLGNHISSLLTAICSSLLAILGFSCSSTDDVPVMYGMPTGDFLKVIDSLTPHVNPNHVNIIITGGEPLLRKDLEYVGRQLYDRGYPWGIVSNGLALTSERFQRLRRAGIHAMTISLDGLKDDHNWMRCHPDSFDRATSAIRMAAATPDINFDVVTCVNQRTLHRLSEIKEHLISCGVKAWRLFTIFPSGRAAVYEEFKMGPEEMKTLMEFIKATRKEGRIKASYCCEGFLGSYEGVVRDHFFSCQAGVSVASVMLDGGIGSCLSIRSDYHQGNIYEDDFWEVWQNKYLPYRDRAWMKTGQCADCNFWRYCEGNGMHLRDSEGRLMHCLLP